jgi:hypothetical protein
MLMRMGRELPRQAMLRVFAAAGTALAILLGLAFTVMIG